MSTFSWYSATPAGFDEQMEYVRNFRREDGPKDGYPAGDPWIVGDYLGRYLSQHLMLAVKKDAQEEGGMIMYVNKEGYWKSLYSHWAPENHMAIVACGLMQIQTLRPATTAAIIQRFLKDLDRQLNTRETYTDVPEWVKILVMLGR